MLEQTRMLLAGIITCIFTALALSASAYAAPLFDNSTRNETYTVTKILDTKRKIPMDWTGSIQTCNAGTVNPDFQEGTIWTVNYARALAGLNPL